MVEAEPEKTLWGSNVELFQGLLSAAARATLERGGFLSFARSSDADVRGYVQHFSGLWASVGDGFVPDPKEVLRQMDERESLLYELWKLALRDDFTHDTPPWSRSRR
jgi:hypothetical protein